MGQNGIYIDILRLLIDPNALSIEGKLNSHLNEQSCGRPRLPWRLNKKGISWRRQPGGFDRRTLEECANMQGRYQTFGNSMPMFMGRVSRHLLLRTDIFAPLASGGLRKTCKRNFTHLHLNMRGQTLIDCRTCLHADSDLTVKKSFARLFSNQMRIMISPWKEGPY